MTSEKPCGLCFDTLFGVCIFTTIGCHCYCCGCGSRPLYEEGLGKSDRRVSVCCFLRTRYSTYFHWDNLVDNPWVHFLSRLDLSPFQKCLKQWKKGQFIFSLWTRTPLCWQRAGWWASDVDCFVHLCCQLSKDVLEGSLCVSIEITVLLCEMYVQKCLSAWLGRLRLQVEC